jgi:hypothetical protein
MDEIMTELELMQKAEEEYTANPNPPSSAFQEHSCRVQRFLEITSELSNLAEDFE